MELCNAAAERAVLAGIFNHGIDAYVDASDIVTPNSFILESNQLLYKCFEHTYKDGEAVSLDLPTIISAAKVLGFATFFEKKEELEHLRAIKNFPINKENVRRFAATIRKLEIARLLVGQLDNAGADVRRVTGEESIQEILGLVEKPIFDFALLLNNAGMEGPQLLGAGLQEYLDYLGTNQRDTVGISTGYAKLDAAIGGGLRNKTVNLIGARPKTGKTFLVNNIALHIAAKLNIPVLNCDTEMSKEDQSVRALANLSGVSSKLIETGKFYNNTINKDKVKGAAKLLESIPYDYVSIAGMPFEDIVALMRRWVMRKVGIGNPCVIFYDYVKLMSQTEVGGSLQEFQALGFIMTGLHNFAVKYNLPVVAMAQLNRDGIDKDTTAVISGSDRLIWLCSNFSIYKKKDPEEIAAEPKAGNRKFIPIVGRHGADWEDGDYINMIFDGDLGRIVEGKTRNELNNIGHVNDGEPIAFD